MSARFPASDTELDWLLRRGVAEIVPEAEFVRALQSGKSLRLKMGFDPTSPDIHLGHAVGLRKLRQLQELGHTVVLIVGDWTARLGDPSGRSATRPMLTQEQVEENAATYLAQFFNIVDKARTEVRFQSEWFDEFKLADVLRLTARFTVAQMLERDDFSRRYASQAPISVSEFLYPMLQAYDSTQMLADVEFGGTDQKFNCLLGRQLQGLVGQTPQQVVLVPLLVAPDGAKMSKSLGNAIGITEPAGEMFGKVMSIRDDLMADYFRLVTDVPDAEIQAMAAGMAEGSLNPRDAKLRLASEIVLQFHGADAARQAREEFERVFSRKELPADMPDLSVGGEATVDIASLLVAAGHFASKGEVRRLLSQGAVELAGVKLDQALIPADRLKDGDVLRVGKRTFLRVRKA